MLLQQMPNTTMLSDPRYEIRARKDDVGWRRYGRGRGSWGLNRELEHEDQAREKEDILLRDNSLEKAWRQPAAGQIWEQGAGDSGDGRSVRGQQAGRPGSGFGPDLVGAGSL